MKKWMLVCLLCLSGCSSQVMNSKLPNLVGKEIDYAIDILGEPTTVKRYGNRQVVEWAFTHKGLMFHSGLVPQNKRKANCSITLRVKKDIITDWNWEGNDQGCKFYTSRVEKIEDNKQATN